LFPPASISISYKTGSGRTRCGISGISFQEYGSRRPLTPRNSESTHLYEMYGSFCRPVSGGSATGVGPVSQIKRVGDQYIDTFTRRRGR
jgi:hypothetical protein